MAKPLKMEDYITYVKRKLGGARLRLEISDEEIGNIVLDALQEINPYYNQTAFITIPYSKCIDLTDFDYRKIIHVYRTEGFTGDTTTSTTSSTVDPMYAQQWMAFSNGGTTYNLNSYVLNYLAYNTLLQINNTTTTDMAFDMDKTGNKLYINCKYDIPTQVTLEYYPSLTDVSQINSEDWIIILKAFSVALAKEEIGRIRNRFTQSNALWNQDGETLLSEGKEEAQKLRDYLKTNKNMGMGVD